MKDPDIKICVRSQEKREEEGTVTKQDSKNNPQTTLKMAVNTYPSIITSNVDRLNISIKGINWVNTYKSKTHICAAYKELTFTSKNMHRSNVRGRKSHFM